MISKSTDRQEQTLPTPNASSSEADPSIHSPEGITLSAQQSPTKLVSKLEKFTTTNLEPNYTSSPYEGEYIAHWPASRFLDNAAGRQRRAVANALFDPDSLTLLERLAAEDKMPLEKLAVQIDSPLGWTKFGILMQAYFVEILGAQVRITSEGRNALNQLRKFMESVSITTAE